MQIIIQNKDEFIKEKLNAQLRQQKTVYTQMLHSRSMHYLPMLSTQDAAIKKLVNRIAESVA